MIEGQGQGGRKLRLQRVCMEDGDRKGESLLGNDCSDDR